MDNTTAIIELAKENALLRRCLADVLLALESDNCAFPESKFYVFDDIIKKIVELKKKN